LQDIIYANYRGDAIAVNVELSGAKALRERASRSRGLVEWLVRWFFFTSLICFTNYFKYVK